jgi:hypothetical protein
MKATKTETLSPNYWLDILPFAIIIRYNKYQIVVDFYNVLCLNNLFRDYSHKTINIKIEYNVEIFYEKRNFIQKLFFYN